MGRQGLKLTVKGLEKALGHTALLQSVARRLGRGHRPLTAKTLIRGTRSSGSGLPAHLRQTRKCPYRQAEQEAERSRLYRDSCP